MYTNNLKYYLQCIVIHLTPCLLLCCKSDPNIKNEFLEQLSNNKALQESAQSKMDSVLAELNKVKTNQSHLPIGNLSAQFDNLKKGVYLILTQTGESINLGTAFIISNNGLALSNYHVFKNSEKALAINSEGDHFDIDLIKVVKINPLLDYILFYIEDPKSFNLVSTLSMPKIGDECFAIGNPDGLQLTLSTGIISGYRFEDTLLQTTAPITHGSSGGPLFNSIGEVIGITSGGKDQGSLNFAINIKMILDDISKNQIDSAIANNEDRNLNEISPKEINHKDLINQFYSNLFNNKYSKLNNFLSDTLDRFDSDSRVLRFNVIDKYKKYYQLWEVLLYEIENISIKEKSNENFEGEALLKLTLKNIKDQSVKSYILNSHLEFNALNKITWISDELIELN